MNLFDISAKNSETAKQQTEPIFSDKRWLSASIIMVETSSLYHLAREISKYTEIGLNCVKNKQTLLALTAWPRILAFSLSQFILFYTNAIIKWQLCERTENARVASEISTYLDKSTA